MKVKARSLLCLLAAGLILAPAGWASTPRAQTLLTNGKYLPKSHHRPLTEKTVVMELSPNSNREVTLKVGQSVKDVYWVTDELNPRRYKIAIYEKRSDGWTVVVFKEKGWLNRLFKRQTGPYLINEDSLGLMAGYFDISHQRGR